MVVGQGLCRKHYMRLRRKGATDDARKNARGVCSVEGCDRPHQAKGLCELHWRSARQMAARVSAKQQRACAHCGEPVPLSRPYRGEFSFCSQQCKGAAYTADGRSAATAMASYYRRRYNLTRDQVDEMALGGCAICGTTDWPGRHARPHVDHCHTSGRVRGILCHECNTGLGKFKDDPALLRAAAIYVDQGANAP